MENFTYYHKNKTNLRLTGGCNWLRDVGLKETQWILDIDWFLKIDGHLTFNEWIDEKKKDK